MKLSTKMLLGTTLLALAPVLVTSALVGNNAVSMAQESLTDAVRSQLTSMREVRKRQLTDYFQQLAGSLQALAGNAVLTESVKDLRTTFATAGDSVKPEVLQRLRDELRPSYLKDFAAEYANRNPDTASGLDPIVNALTPAQVVLQHAYITANPNKLGEKNKLSDAAERSPYSLVHARIHPSIEALRSRVGYYDVFLIDAQTDRVVYTSFKELDFTSSLTDGPAAKTGLGEVYRKARAARADQVVMSDYAPYFLSYNDQAAFMAVPLLENGKVTGVLVAQLPLDNVSAVMTASKSWRTQGLGDTGETYLVGADRLMRTDSRFLLEDKSAFLREFGSKLDATALSRADKKNTSIGIIKVDTAGANEAIAGESGFKLIDDYRNTPVFSAYAPLDIYGVRFALLAELDQAEALIGATALKDQTLLRTLVIAFAVLVLSGLAAFFLVRAVTRPVNSLSALVRRVADGDDEARSTVKTGDELQELGDTFNKLLDDRIATLSKVNRENDALNESVVGLLQTMFQLSQRNLFVRAPVTADIVGTVADSVNMLADATSTALSDVKTVAGEVETSSRRVNGNAEALARQSEQDRIAIARMTDDLSQTALLMEQVAALAEQSRRAADEARATTASALHSVSSTVTEMGGIRESIGEMEKRLKRLGERSQEISQIVGVINSISERTHVLALNASMQAAMAGEAGRGFAVVTEEVQRLADASRNATMQVAQLAQNIQLETSETVAALNRTVSEVVEGSKIAETSGAQMRETEAATERLADAVRRIAGESSRQLELAKRLSQSAAEISESTERNTHAVRGATEDAATLAESSRRLTAVVAEFNLSAAI